MAVRRSWSSDAVEMAVRTSYGRRDKASATVLDEPDVTKAVPSLGVLSLDLELHLSS